MKKTTISILACAAAFSLTSVAFAGTLDGGSTIPTSAALSVTATVPAYATVNLDLLTGSVSDFNIGPTSPVEQSLLKARLSVVANESVKVTAYETLSKDFAAHNDSTMIWAYGSSSPVVAPNVEFEVVDGSVTQNLYSNRTNGGYKGLGAYYNEARGSMTFEDGSKGRFESIIIPANRAANETEPLKMDIHNFNMNVKFNVALSGDQAWSYIAPRMYQGQVVALVEAAL